ncbi:TetR/AcrR family transcriptional regulator [Ferrimonas pelagia]|uniref:TetR/AcrR family transcriptional regulator n=1 Tax=Ferrimonas pelagia TaxID=1177826 RepID=A0ABP9ECQ1_9GAMM
MSQAFPQQEPNSDPSKVGRPSLDTSHDVRGQLLMAARELFSVQPFARVSTRMLAAQAKTSIGMIRYYFGSKSGLFEAMISELFQPLFAELVASFSDGDGDNLEQAILTYYRHLHRHPMLPRMVQQVMSMPDSEPQRQIAERVFDEVLAVNRLGNCLSQSGLLRDDIEPQFAKISLMSTLVFPFLIPSGIKKLVGLELDMPTLTRLARHQANQLRQGILIGKSV